MTTDVQLLPLPPHLNTSATNTGLTMLLHRSQGCCHNCRAGQKSLLPLTGVVLSLLSIFSILPGLLRGSNMSCHRVSGDVLSTCGSFSLLYHLSCVLAPDTPPQFLRARKLAAYEVELSWQPPLEANSDVLYYVVRVW